MISRLSSPEDETREHIDETQNESRDEPPEQEEQIDISNVSEEVSRVQPRWALPSSDWVNDEI